MDCQFFQWRLLPVAVLLTSVAFFFYFQSSYNALTRQSCTLLPHSHFLIVSKRVVTPEGVISGAVEVKSGVIVSITRDTVIHSHLSSIHVIDFGDAVVMPGLIDVHVHLDEPGRTDWEGFLTGTKAAAAGGITTLVDMPLNSHPSTISAETLKLKLASAEKNIYVDIGFWGGLVPENSQNKSMLEGLLDAGALGLKSFMCPSGINDFPMTNVSHIKEGLSVLAKYKRPLLVHSEVQHESEDNFDEKLHDPRKYSTYLNSRPPSMEETAIKELLKVSKETRIGGSSEGAHLHIVHLSDAGSSLNLLNEAKARGDSISVETCPHYLAFTSEEIQDGDTRFKCAPPIRDSANQEALWKGLLAGDIDLLSSDHSPTLPNLKLFSEGNFLKAWGGISSLQFVLPVTWTYGKNHGVSLEKLAKWWSEKPAKLASQHLRGAIAVGNYADFAVWEPEVEVILNESFLVFIKHPSISAYLGRKLSGNVLATFVRGNLVYENGKHAPDACGVAILAK